MFKVFAFLDEGMIYEPYVNCNIPKCILKCVNKLHFTLKTANVEIG